MPLQGLKDGVVFGVDGQDDRAASGAVAADDVPREHERFLVGEADDLAMPGRRFGGAQSCGPHLCGEDGSGLRQGRHGGIPFRADVDVRGVPGGQQVPQLCSARGIQYTEVFRTPSCGLRGQLLHISSPGQCHHSETVRMCLDDAKGAGADGTCAPQQGECARCLVLPFRRWHGGDIAYHACSPSGPRAASSRPKRDMRSNSIRMSSSVVRWLATHRRTPARPRTSAGVRKPSPDCSSRCSRAT